MKSIIPAALVVVLEAGFLFSVAVLPSQPGSTRASPELAVRQAPAARPVTASVAAARPASRS